MAAARGKEEAFLPQSLLWLLPTPRRPSFRWGGVAAPSLLGLVVRTSNLVGGVRLGQPAASGCSPPALSSAPEPQRLQKVRGGEFGCVTGEGPEEAGRGRAPEGYLRTAVTSVPLSHCLAVSGWCLRRRLARSSRSTVAPGRSWRGRRRSGCARGARACP